MASRYRQLAALIAAAFILVGASPTVSAQSWQWVHEGSGSGNDLVGGVAVDSLGNAYTVGTFERNIAFGATVFTNGASTGLYLVKYNAQGVLQWVISGIGAGNFLSTSVAVAPSGEIFVAGTYNGTVRFGTDTLKSQGGTEGFIARFNTANGSLRWFRRAGLGLLDTWCKGVAVDRGINPYITGYFQGTAVFDTSTIISSAGNDVFVAKYDRNGVIQWARAAGGNGSDEANAIGVDGTGNSYVCGRFTGTSIFGVDTMREIANGDAFVAKFGPLGAPTWATPMGGKFADVANGIAVDAFGNSHITGAFADTAAFDTTGLISRGASDVFLAKVDGVGSIRWARRMGSATNDAGYAVAIDPVGAVYATGTVSDTATFGNVTLPIVPNNADVFVVKYDGGGAFQWVRNAASGSRDEGHGIAVDNGNELRVAGVYSDTAAFGQLSVRSTAALDVFTAKLGADPTITIGLLQQETYCAGDQFLIPFSTKGVFTSGNYYVGQLSDTSGGFANPLEVGRVYGVGGSTIVAKIPDTLKQGTHYRVRIVSTLPIVTSPINPKDLSIFQTPKPLVTPAGPINICQGDTVILDGGTGFTTYLWNSGDRGRFVKVGQSGQFAVTVSNDHGCAGTSPAIVVTVHKAAMPGITRIGQSLQSTPATKYQWYDQSGPRAGDTNQILANVLNGGTYRVQITDSFGCKAFSEAFTFPLTGVPLERALQGVKLYPHPNTGLFTIAFGTPGSARVDVAIFDALGRQVAAWQDETSGGDYSRRVDIRAQPAGLYVVRIDCGGRQWIGQVVKE